MALPNSITIFKKIVEIYDPESVINLEQMIKNVLSSINENSYEAELDYLAHKKKNSVKKQITKYHERCNKKNVPPIFTWSSSYPDRLIGRSHIFSDDVADTVKLKKRLLDFNIIKSCFIDLDKDQFEILSCLVLDLEGCEEIRRTVRTRDKAIDIYGYLSIQPPIDKIKFIGGATRSDVGEPKIREFFRAITLFELKDRSLRSRLPNDFLEEDMYVMGYFFTARGYSSDVENMDDEDKYKLYLYDGDQITSILCRNAICFNYDLSFNLVAFEEYLNSLNETYPLPS